MFSFAPDFVEDCEEALNNPISQKNIDSLTKALSESLSKLNGVKPSNFF